MFARIFEIFKIAQVSERRGEYVKPLKIVKEKLNENSGSSVKVRPQLYEDPLR